MIFHDMLMKLLKRYLIANSMNSDIIVAQHPIIQNDVKIILYAYTQSVFSGRRIEKLLHDSIRMMWLAQNQTPSYKTINRFRVNPNTDALIESLFIQFHSQCLKQNLIDHNSIFIDGTKVEANANRYTFVWKKSIPNHESKLNENSKTLYRDLVEEKLISIK